jgi:hypothetical protein
MKSLLDAWRAGDGRAKLGILADLMSVLGVSVIVATTSLLALAREKDIEALLGPPILLFFAIGALSLSLVVMLALTGLLKRTFSDSGTARALMLLSAWSFFLIGVVIFGGLIIQLWTTTEW